MSSPTIRARRSLIFAPGNKPELFDKAMQCGADMLTIDLEDAIAPNHKDIAREKTIHWFSENPSNAGKVERVVRLNCIRTVEGLADLQTIVESQVPIPSLMLAKIKSADEVRIYDELLQGALSGTRLHVIVETNEGLEVCQEIAQASDRIDSLLFGGVDMSAELRVEPVWNALLYARCRLVHAAATAGIDFIDVPFLDLQDMQGLADEAQRCVEIGMTGKAAIHPKQISTINDAFTPSAEAIQRAKDVIAEFEHSDSGLVVIDNKLVEKPVLRSMYRTLAIAETLR